MKRVPVMRKTYTTIGVRFDGEDYRVLEEWRKAQPIVPSLSAAVRYLVSLGINGLKGEDLDD